MPLLTQHLMTTSALMASLMVFSWTICKVVVMNTFYCMSIPGLFFCSDTPQCTPVKKGASEGGVAYRAGQATPLGNSFDTGFGAGFMHVDLQQDTSTPKIPFNDALGRRRSPSVSSLASDSSFMFPVLESPGPTYNFQVVNCSLLW